MIRIIPFEDRYHADFKRLNLAWLEKFALTEQYDLDVLDNPQKTVLDKQGAIFLAMDGEKVVGTAGICMEEAGIFELVKMAVDPAYRGRGISKDLLNACLQDAGDKNATKIFLYSNSQLKTALHLYEQYGFQYKDASNSHLVTADIKMELSLSDKS
ncbi:MAG TPA: GNAT family N-acetyltransferase [Chitinophagaceae bacterium]|nr:GNAT family N-acetyltransferase [Chitinophagaceae bacterium]